MSLKIDVQERRKNSYLLTLAGRLDSETAPILEKKLAPLLNPETRHLIFHMDGLDYISSIGLRVILSASKYMKESKGELLVTHLQSQVSKVFELANILPATDIFKSVEGADTFLDAVQRKKALEHMDVDD